MRHTLAAAAAHTIEVRHSRFLAQAAPVSTVEAALAFLSNIADRNATHNCWAYRIGTEYRSSDDGEPSGTAGRPILAAIDGQGYDRVCVVVTRWYGGIKLGAGGLVRAYGGAAAECLRVAERRPLIEMRTLALQAGFDDIGAVHATLAGHAATKLDEVFGSNGIDLRVSVAADQVDALAASLRNATRGRAKLQSQ